MDYMAAIEELVLKLTGMETMEKYLSESESMTDGDACMHLNMSLELGKIKDELKEIFAELDVEKRKAMEEEPGSIREMINRSNV